MTEMTSFCGYRCDLYAAGSNDPEIRQRMVDGWRKGRAIALGAPGHDDIPPQAHAGAHRGGIWRVLSPIRKNAQYGQAAVAGWETACLDFRFLVYQTRKGNLCLISKGGA